MKDGKTQGEGSSSVAVWVVCCCAAAHHLTTGMVHFLPALYALEMGASPAVIGLVPAAHSLPGLLLALPGGKVVDRLGPRRVALSATLCRVAAVLCYLLVPSPIWITIPSFLSGALGTFAVVSLHTYIGSLAVGTKRTQQISRFAVFTSAGELLAPALAGILLDLFGFQVAFICAAATSFFTSACVFFLPGVSHQQERRSGEPAAARGFRGILRHEGIQVALWGIWSIASIQGFLRGFLPVLLRQSFPATQIGFLFLAASGASVAGRYAVGWMAGRWALAKIFPVSVGFGRSLPNDPSHLWEV